MSRFTQLAMILFLGVVVSYGQPTNSSHEQDVRRLAQPLIDGKLVPGLVVGVYDQGRTEVYGLGVISKEKTAAPDGTTIYEIGSVTKVFTGLLLAEAVTRGEVTLDTPLSKLLPSDVKPPKHDDQEITLEELATHFSGLPKLPANMPADTFANPYADYGRDKLFAFLNGYRLARTPGTAFEYSNLGAGLLGTLLSDKAGSTYEDLLRRRITAPLAMTNTTIALSAEQQRRLAPP